MYPRIGPPLWRSSLFTTTPTKLSSLPKAYQSPSGVRKVVRTEDAGGTHHIAEVAPLVEKVAIHINAVRLREVFGDYLADGFQVEFFLAAIILHVSKVLTVIAA